jgi:cytoskeletal protein CcmA (bactofilin family)
LRYVRRVHDTEGETLVARHARVSGRVETPGSLRIEGRVEGMVRAADRVVIGRTGVAISEIEARFVEIRGVVIGNVSAEVRIDVHEGARVVGDLVAPNVDLDAGATIEGRVDRAVPAEPAAEPPRAAAGAERQTVRLRHPVRRPTRPDLEHDVPELPALRGEAPAVDDDPRKTAPRLPRLGSRARLVPRKVGENT